MLVRGDGLHRAQFRARVWRTRRHPPLSAGAGPLHRSKCGHRGTARAMVEADAGRAAALWLETAAARDRPPRATARGEGALAPGRDLPAVRYRQARSSLPHHPRALRELWENTVMKCVI